MCTINMIVKEFIKIISGYTFRKALSELGNGDTRIIQISDIQLDLSITDNTKLSQIDGLGMATQAKVRNNDILLSSKGNEKTGFKASLYKGYSLNTVVASSVYILRIDKNKEVIPEYIVFYLNSYKGQNLLKNLSLGSLIKTLSKNNLEKLEIPIPSLENQKTIAKLAENITEQKKLHIKKIEATQSILKQVLASTKTYE